MSSAQNQPPQPPESASPTKAQPDAQEKLNSELVPSAETDMDQHSDSTLSMTSPASPPPSDPIMSSTPTQPNSAPAESASPDAATTVDIAADEQTAIPRQQPIPPASEPMQYRAIGLTRGVYTPSDEQFTRGTILTQEGVVINAVLLGRVMSLVKKHLDLAEPHLWVVYPRTRANVDDLHLQIVGVWEPENLNRTSAQSDEDLTEEELASELAETEADTEADIETDTEADIDDDEPFVALAESAESAESAEESSGEPDSPEAEPAVVSAETKPSIAADETEPDENYFSVRGEIIFQSIEQEQLLIKIQQAPRRPTESPKAFKLALKGTVQGKAVGYFWDLNVQRQDNTLVVQDGTMIAAVPPKKRQSKFGNRRRPGGGGGGGRRPGPPNRRQGDRPSPSPQASQPRREPLSKPIKRKDKEST
ncbi:hypothetical protein [Oculatella sp. LEGE 06141]|uniref:hypothetical protein n=1 Tax=Oculatella sp. LEGE 06141 TaxID=1828648 RepID=UPI001D14A068|nr:hypothetical protein [Oculatella sp. LEGE 06141]